MTDEPNSEVIILDLEIYNVHSFGVSKEVFHVKLWVLDPQKYVKNNRHTPALQRAIIELGLIQRNRGFIELAGISEDGNISLVIKKDLETQEETPTTHFGGFEPKVGDLVEFRGWDHTKKVVGSVRGLIIDELEVPELFRVFSDGRTRIFRDTEMRLAVDCDRNVEISKILTSISVIMADRPGFPHKDLILAACI